jgi:hypothetical protein
MSKLIKIGVALAIALVGLATPAHADPTPTPAQDVEFQRLLASNGIPFNGITKAQGLRVCEQVERGPANGGTVVRAINDLTKMGGYSWDVANFLATDAGIAYCMEAFSNAMRTPPPPSSSYGSLSVALSGPERHEPRWATPPPRSQSPHGPG